MQQFLREMDGQVSLIFGFVKENSDIFITTADKMLYYIKKVTNGVFKSK
jgi:hypothetical protein